MVPKIIQTGEGLGLFLFVEYVVPGEGLGLFLFVEYVVPIR
jgi:hypothetical protein